MTPLASWIAVIGGAALLWLLYRSLDGWLGRRIEKEMTKNDNPWRWGGEPGTRAPRGQRGCRDCGYFYPRGVLGHEGVCPDCLMQDRNIQAMLDYSFENDVVFVMEPCRHPDVEWVEHDGGPTMSLICSTCRVALVTEVEPMPEWIDEPEDHR